MSKARSWLYILMIAICFPIGVLAAFHVMAGKLGMAGLIVIVCYVVTFAVGLIFMAIKLREGGVKMRQNGSKPQEIRAFYQSMLWPIVWTVFKAALIAGTILSPLAVLMIGPSL